MNSTNFALMKSAFHTSTHIVCCAYAKAGHCCGLHKPCLCACSQAGAHSHQWVTSLKGNSCIPREVRACHRYKPLAEAQRERFNCSSCHAEIIQRAADSQMVVCNKSSLFTRVVCYSAYCLLLLIVFDE